MVDWGVGFIVRIPPYFMRTGVRRFFAGLMIGTLLGWSFFIFQYGQVHEELLLKLSEKEALVQELEKKINELRSEQVKINEENKKKLTVQQIEVYFTTSRKLRLNQLTLFELRKEALQELQFIEGKDIETVANMKDIVIAALENKIFHIGEQYYQLKVKEVYLFTTLQLYVDIDNTFQPKP